MFKRFAISVSTLCLLAAGLVFASSPASGVAGFGDVPDTAFYTDAVQWMVDKNITTGTSRTCFSPGDPVTRGQAAAFMWRMEGEKAAPAHPFTDVTAAYQQAPVSWMAATKITTGTSPSTYSPNDELTRGQLAALLHRLAGELPASGHPFTDITAVWQQAPVAWMVANKITSGTSPTTFSPNDTVTRGQLATFFYRYKGEPGVTVDTAHPAFVPCESQVIGAALEFAPGLTRDIAFALAEDQIWMLDLYMPSGPKSDRPSVIYAHGRGGDKADTSPLMVWGLVDQGYVVASINYRQLPNPLSDQDVVDAQHDMQAAVRWFRANGSELGIDTDRIFVAGHSAGGAASMYTVFNSENPGASGNAEYSSRVAGGISLASTGWNTSFIEADEPPILMLNGTADAVVPIGLAEVFCGAVTATGNECELVTYVGAGHSLWPHEDDIVARIAAFIESPAP